MKLSAKAGNQLLEVTVERENGQYRVSVDGVPHLVDAHKLEADFYSILSGGRSYEVSVAVDGDGYRVRHGAAEQRITITDPGRRARESLDGGEGPAEITTAMPGKVVRVLVAEGDEVESGQGLVVVEAMKMENEIASPKAGAVRSINVQPGQAVEGGTLLAVVD